ncbi:MAG: alcohol dehydrogenase catalytic domain-containing protein [Myxococcota bacterium]
MKAVVCRGPGRVAVEEIDDPTPQAGEVKLEVAAVGVCHTDLNFTSGSVPVPFPIVLGHEGAGRVVEVGPGVRGIRVGDHVLCSIIGPCEECFQCVRDEPALCERAPMYTGTMLDGTTRLSKRGEPIHTLHYQGSYAEYAIVPERFVTKIRDDAPLEVVCGLACGVSTGLGAAIVRAKVEPGSSVVVIGSGGVGLSTMLGARFRGATTVVAVDKLAHKAAKAVELGFATHALDASATDVVKAVQELTRGRGADYGFDAVGVAGTLEQAIAATRPGATVVVIGRALGSVELRVETSALLRHRTLTGTFGGSIHPRRHLPELVELCMQGRLDLAGILDTRYTLDEAPKALDDLHHGRITRGVIVLRD